MLEREENQTFPLEVYYRISEKGRTLGPILAATEQWANEHAEDEVAKLMTSKRPFCYWLKYCAQIVVSLSLNRFLLSFSLKRV